MRRRAAVPLVPALAVVLALVASAPAAADPRMETNDNFCHFILDPDNTDNEYFVAGCNPTIATVEPSAPDVTVECLRLVARGYCEREVVLPQGVVRLPAGSSRSFTNEDSTTPCTMVESNGRSYRSHKWQSTITVEATDVPGRVRVRYALACVGGRP